VFASNVLIVPDVILLDIKYKDFVYKLFALWLVINILGNVPVFTDKLPIDAFCIIRLLAVKLLFGSIKLFAVILL
jgi:hypothetical protein